MKIRACKFVKGNVISTYKINIWTAAGWALTGKSLASTLLDKAYEAAGVNPGSSMYGTDIVVRGSPQWEFEVKVYPWDCVEATE